MQELFCVYVPMNVSRLAWGSKRSVSYLSVCSRCVLDGEGSLAQPPRERMTIVNRVVYGM